MKRFGHGVFSVDRFFLFLFSINEIKYDKDAYSFSRYWFGGGPSYYAVVPYGSQPSGPVMRWTPNIDSNLSPAHYWIWGGLNKPLDNYMFPGVYRDDAGLNYGMYPVAAPLFGAKAKSGSLNLFHLLPLY